MEVLGGFDKRNKYAAPTTQYMEGYFGEYNIGRNASYGLRSRIVDWHFLDKSKPKKVIENTNDILNLAEKIDNPRILCILVIELYNLPDKDLIKAFSKIHNIMEPLEIAFSKLYHTYRDFIDLAIGVLLKEISMFSKYYDENSVILPKIHEIAAEILSKSEKLNGLNDYQNKKIRTFFSSKVLKNYTYMQYCPHEPVKRIASLLTFPIRELLNVIKMLNPMIFLGLDIEEIYKEIYGTVEQIEKSSVEDKLNAGISISRTKLKLGKGSYDELLKVYMGEFINLYGQVLPILETREKFYISAANSINEMIYILKKLFLGF